MLSVLGKVGGIKLLTEGIGRGESFISYYCIWKVEENIMEETNKRSFIIYFFMMDPLK